MIHYFSMNGDDLDIVKWFQYIYGIVFYSKSSFRSWFKNIFNHITAQFTYSFYIETMV